MIQAVTGAIANKETSGKLLKIVLWVIGGILILITALIATLYIRRAIRKKRDKKLIGPVQGGGTIRSDFSPAKYALKMYYATQDTNDGSDQKEGAAALLMGLTDNELIQVNNVWNTYLYSKYSENMYQAMNNEWYTPEFWSNDSQWAALKARLIRLGLNGTKK